MVEPTLRPNVLGDRGGSPHEASHATTILRIDRYGLRFCAHRSVRTTIRVVDLDVASAAARPRPSVSGLAALHRAATGLGVAAAACALLGSVWTDGLRLAFPFLILGSLRWLHDSDDRRHGPAILSAAAVALAVVVGVAVLFRHAPPDFAHDVAGAALGALAGSQIYAAVTRRA